MVLVLSFGCIFLLFSSFIIYLYIDIGRGIKRRERHTLTWTGSQVSLPPGPPMAPLGLLIDTIARDIKLCALLRKIKYKNGWWLDWWNGADSSRSANNRPSPISFLENSVLFLIYYYCVRAVRAVRVCENRRRRRGPPVVKTTTCWSSCYKIPPSLNSPATSSPFFFNQIFPFVVVDLTLISLLRLFEWWKKGKEKRNCGWADAIIDAPGALRFIKKWKRENNLPHVVDVVVFFFPSSWVGIDESAFSFSSSSSSYLLVPDVDGLVARPSIIASDSCFC